MTIHLDCHVTTDCKPEMLSGIKTGNRIPHDEKITRRTTTSERNKFFQVSESFRQEVSESKEHLASGRQQVTVSKCKKASNSFNQSLSTCCIHRLHLLIDQSNSDLISYIRNGKISTQEATGQYWLIVDNISQYNIRQYLRILDNF